MREGILIFIFMIFLFVTQSFAQTYKISLLLGDTHTKAALQALKTLNTKELGVEIKLYPLKDIRTKDLSFLADSSLIIVNIMGRQIVQEVKEELKSAISKGAKVYAVAASGSYNDEIKAMGILYDKTVETYYQNGGPENLKNLILYLLKKDLGLEVAYREPIVTPEFAIYDSTKKRVYTTFEEYVEAKGEAYFKKPLIGLVFYKSYYDSGQLLHIDAVIEALEREGFSVLPVYGFPSELAIERYFFDEKGAPRVRAVVGLALKVGLNPKSVVPILSKLGVPVLNAISLYTQSRREWEASPVGLDIFERAWQIALPELGGIIQPTVIASKERVVDIDTGLEYIEERPIPERIERLVGRIKGWINLQEKPNRDKRVAIIYYNYPPGKQNIGASYLNVLPESLYEILQRLKKEGFDLGNREISKDELFEEIMNYGRNIGNWAWGELERLVKSGRPVMIPIEKYKVWFNELPENLKRAVVKDWGKPEESKIMTWHSPNGTKYLVLPVVQFGNILLAPQPSRGWEQNVEKLYHDVTLSPHHQYLAFYLWLKKEFKADAIAHIGTHATHEWLSGKEVGFTEEDPPEIIVQNIPQIYPYVVDNVGEGLQAKRRGMAVIIDHMTPPFDKAGLNKDLRELLSLIDEYYTAVQKSSTLAEMKLFEINSLAQKMGILTDFGIKEIKSADEVEELQHHIKSISEMLTPFGLHTFGKSPEEKYIKSTAEAILSIEKGLAESERTKRLTDYEERIRQSGERELDSFISALMGKYVPSGPGNDPIRNPDSLPTGKNFYSFDPTRIPSRKTFELGVKLAKDLIEGYKNRYGKYPDKLTFNLWATETMRHEGVMESQILYLLGIRPKWDERGRVEGVEAIPRAELGRLRIDVTIILSGLYRDLFPNLMALLDKAVSLAKEQLEEDNLVRQNVIKTKKILMEKGFKEDLAERLATVRIFTEPPGAYGTNLDKVISMSNTWEDEKQVIEVYFRRMSYLFGQGFWGEKIQNQSGSDEKTKEDISLTLLKNALSGSKMVVHSRSTNLYATLDNDDFFQYLGGTAMATRVLDGKTPDLYITNLSNPKEPKQESLEKFMGREMRSRYLNPEWIKAMMREGYAGARFVDKVVEHLWGWQVTVPEVIDEAKWREMYETYVLDKNGLGIKELFRQAKNLWAYQSIVARMLETIRKKYWMPEREVVETLAREYAETVREIGFACCDHTCNNPLLAKFTRAILMSVPGLQNESVAFAKALQKIKLGSRTQFSPSTEKKGTAQPLAPDERGKRVEGFEMQETTLEAGLSSAPIPYLFLLGFLVLIGLIAVGFKRKSL